MKSIAPDVLVCHEGTVFVFCPLTPRAKQWIQENVSSEGWQWFGDALVIEHRYAWGLGQGMKDAGLRLAYGNSPIGEPKSERDTWESTIDRACEAQAKAAAQNGGKKRTREEVEQFVLTVLMMASDESKRSEDESN
jgi:hypothetical protein